MIGPTEDETARAFQYIGIAASLLSITKGCGEWWTRSREGSMDDTKWTTKDAPLSTTLQVSLFFLPHVLFRTSAWAFVGAFLGYFALGPIALAVFIVIGLAVYSFFKYDEDGVVFSLALTIFAPTLFVSGEACNRSLMKRAITVFTSILLLSLTCIRIAPTIIHPDTLVSTYGLRHLNFMDPAGGSRNVFVDLQLKITQTFKSHFSKLVFTFVAILENYSQHWCAVNTCTNETGDRIICCRMLLFSIFSFLQMFDCVPESRFISNCTNMTDIVGNGTGNIFQS